MTNKQKIFEVELKGSDAKKEFYDTDYYKVISKQIQDKYKQLNKLVDKLNKKFPCEENDFWAIAGDGRPRIFTYSLGDE